MKLDFDRIDRVIHERGRLAIMTLLGDLGCAGLSQT